MKRITYSFTIFILVCPVLFAQKIGKARIDSLENWLTQHPKVDNNRIDNMVQLGFLYYVISPKKMYKLGEDILAKATKINYPKGVSRGYNFLAYHYIHETNYEKASQILLQKLQYTQKYNLKEDELDTYNILGNLYLSSGNSLPVSLKYFQKAYNGVLQLPKSENESMFLVSITNSLSMVYGKMGQDSISYIYAKKAVDIFYKSPSRNNTYEVPLLQNFAAAAIELDRHEEAIEPLEKLLITSRKLGYQEVYNTVCTNLCDVYRKTKQLGKARKMLLLLKEQEKTDALSLTDKNLYYRSISELESAQGNYEEAYQAQSQYITIQDSIRNTEQNNKINELNTQYETKKKEEQIQLLEQNKELQNQQKKLYIFTALVLLGLLLLSLYSIVRIRKAKKRVEMANRMRDRMFTFIAHDIKSPVSTLQNITKNIDVILKKKDPQQLQLLGNTIQNIATNLFTLVDNLLGWATAQQEQLPYRPTNMIVEDEVRGVADAFQSAFRLKDIHFVFDTSTETSAFADPTTIQTIIRNLLDNAIKFTPRHGNISVELYKNEKYVSLLVKDSGAGIDPALLPIIFENQRNKSRIGTEGEKGNGLGIYLCKQLAILNKGNLIVEKTSNTGTTFLLTIPCE